MLITHSTNDVFGRTVPVKRAPKLRRDAALDSEPRGVKALSCRGLKAEEPGMFSQGGVKGVRLTNLLGLIDDCWKTARIDETGCAEGQCGL